MCMKIECQATSAITLMTCRIATRFCDAAKTGSGSLIPLEQKPTKGVDIGSEPDPVFPPFSPFSAVFPVPFLPFSTPLPVSRGLVRRVGFR